MAGIVRLGGYAKARPSSLRSRANTRPAHTASSAVLELGPTSERPSSAIRLRARYVGEHRRSDRLGYDQFFGETEVSREVPGFSLSLRTPDLCGCTRA